MTSHGHPWELDCWPTQYDLGFLDPLLCEIDPRKASRATPEEKAIRSLLSRLDDTLHVGPQSASIFMDEKGIGVRVRNDRRTAAENCSTD